MKTDKELVKAIEKMKAGDERGFNVLYSKTYNFVYARAKHAINDEQEALDLVQEVYVAAYKNIGSLKNTESLYAWLGAITMRQGTKMANKKRNHVLLSEEKQGIFEEIPDESVKLESDVIDKENAGILKGLLEKLPAEQKSVIISFYYDGLKVEKIAELTENSVGTIKSRLYLARKRLQEYIVELEKKEGCSLRSVSAPLLLLAVKMLLEETTLSKAAAQGIYNQVCTQAGIQASTLAFQSAGVGEAIGETITGQMKGQGIHMNKFIGKLAGLGKVKLASIAVGVVAVAGAGTAAGVYMHNQAQTEQAATKETAEKKAEEKVNEKLLSDLTKRYEKAEELRDNLILEQAVIDILNRDFTAIKTALDEKSADEKTEEKMTTLEKNLEGYRQQNEQYLTEKEAAMYDYHSEFFPQENQDALDTMLAEYKELFEAVKYKDADKKLDEMNSYMVAFMNENYPEETTEVAENGNSTGENSGNSGNAGNTESSGNNSSAGNSGNTGGSTGGNSGNTGNSGSTGSTETSSEPSTPTESTARWADGRCTEVENDIIATIYSSGMESVYAPLSSQIQSVAESFVSGNIGTEETKQQIADIVLSNTELPVAAPRVNKVTCSGNSYTAGTYGIGGCSWYCVRVYYEVATDTLTIYAVSL